MDERRQPERRDQHVLTLGVIDMLAVNLALDIAGIDHGQSVYTGGGSPALMALLDASRLHIPDLVFEGLEIVAQHH